MKCDIIECMFHEDCGYLEIFKKQPQSFSSCSYSRVDKQKVRKPTEEDLEIVKKKKFKKPKK